MRVLLLGGTREARALAEALVDARLDVTSSLAGRVQRPRMPVGRTRVGGFGGVSGLAAYLREEQVSAVVDATHPFAERISANAVAACAAADVPLLRLARPGWSHEPGAGRWHWVDGAQEAARTAAQLGERVLLTTGRQGLEELTGPLATHSVVARVVDPVDVPLPPTWTVLLDRGPYLLEGERALLEAHDVQVLVTKDSGGDHTRAKLDAADELGVEVVVVRRPRDVHRDPDLAAPVASVSEVAAVLPWLQQQQQRG